MKKLAIFLTTFLLSASAYAAELYDVCNGDAVRWRSNILFERNVCTIPNGSVYEVAYWQGIDAWNSRVTHLVDGFSHRPPTDCTASLGDGINEVLVVPSSTIDGKAGLARLRYNRHCIPLFNQSIMEADVRVSAENNWEYPDHLRSWLGSGFEVFEHEFGHSLGLTHPASELIYSIMRPVVAGLRTGTPPTIPLWPKDAKALDELYGLNTQAPTWCLRRTKLLQAIPARLR